MFHLHENDISCEKRGDFKTSVYGGSAWTQKTFGSVIFFFFSLKASVILEKSVTKLRMHFNRCLLAKYLVNQSLVKLPGRNEGTGC